MSVRTIDNLGLETSVRYASDLETLDTSLIKDSRSVPLYVSIDVTSPDYLSNMEMMLGTRQRNLPFPDFYPPNSYNIQSRPIFMHQLLPQLGSDERLATHIERIKQATERKRENPKKRDHDWEEQQDEEEKERESERLILFLQLLMQLDKILVDVATGRNLYQKG